MVPGPNGFYFKRQNSYNNKNITQSPSHVHLLMGTPAWGCEPYCPGTPAMPSLPPCFPHASSPPKASLKQLGSPLPRTSPDKPCFLQSHSPLDSSPPGPDLGGGWLRHIMSQHWGYPRSHLAISCSLLLLGRALFLLSPSWLSSYRVVCQSWIHRTVWR